MNFVLLYSILFLVIVAIFADPMDRHLVGGVSPIDDPERHNEVVGLLKQHIGKLEHGGWEIVEINRTGQQVVGGIKYYLYGTFKDNTDNSKYAATVTIYSRPWEDFIELNMQDKQQVE